MTLELEKWNHTLREASPLEVVEWALSRANKPVITTNFRPYEVALLHLVTSVKADIPVIWCDTGYNTDATYRHAERLIKRLDLNVDLHVPEKTSAHLNAHFDGIPGIESPHHQVFTEMVKLAPFRKAMQQHGPDAWFTNLRQGQTALRDGLDVLSLDRNGLLKISPFYRYTDEALDQYLQAHGLENEHHYFDPTKVLAHRECGLHV